MSKDVVFESPSTSSKSQGIWTPTQLVWFLGVMARAGSINSSSQSCPSWRVNKREAKLLPRSTKRPLCTLDLRLSGHRLPAMAICRVPGEPHSCCPGSGIYIPLPRSYHRKCDLITHIFHFWCSPSGRFQASFHVPHTAFLCLPASALL